MAEVGVHLENVFVVALKRPFESFDVCRSQTQLSATLEQMKSAVELLAHQFLHLRCRSVGRAVVDDEYVEFLFQSEHCSDNLLNVLYLVVCRDDDDTVTCVHNV